MQCFPVKSLVHKVLGGGGVYAYIRYTGLLEPDGERMNLLGISFHTEKK
jgi:hypothetical protein